MKISLYVWVDNAFRLLLLFLFNLIWCTYLFKSPPYNIVVALLVAILACIVINLIDKKKNNRNIPKLKQEQHIKDVTTSFIYMTSQEILEFFKRLVITKHSCEIKDDYIVIKGGSGNIILYPHFKASNFNKDDLAYIVRKIKNLSVKKMIVLSCEYDGNVLSDNNIFPFELILLNATQTYTNLLRMYEFYPEIKLKSKPKTKATISSICSLAFNRKKTKGYLLSALCLFFASFFVIYKVYYLIVSSALVLFAIISYYNPQISKISKEKLLE